MQDQGTALAGANGGNQLVKHSAFNPATDEFPPAPARQITHGHLHITDAIRLAGTLVGRLATSGYDTPTNSAPAPA